ncbi:CAP domain-containing protein [Aeromicrobium sp. 179-A 4D2 NHS]|uniref:CAP domain-containing protein n=1 Tax=Aeromicrobium sp. 179-A 4D2 NHS TaxID=3142375 RepID=UPI0039A15162
MTSLLRVLSALFVAVSLLAVPPVAATAAPKSPAKPVVKVDTKFEKQVKTRTDKSRTAKKLKPLKKNACLNAYARAQAKRQATKQRMYHQNLRPALVRCDMRMVGENVAYGFTSTAKLQKAWMNSPGHRKNILTKKFNRVGVGVYTSKTGVRYYAVVFGQAR